MTPRRIQLSRRGGWRLQEYSRAVNGLEAVKVTRPGIWGNPFIVNPKMKAGSRVGGHGSFVPTAEDAVACYREMFNHDGPTTQALRERLPELRGKNLACFCRAGDPCHADILLELANA